MQTIQVINVKCGGCAKTVTSELEKIGITDIKVGFSEIDSAESRTISFSGDKKIVEQKLLDLGYPEVGTPEAKSILKKAKSFVSCAIGKMQ